MMKELTIAAYLWLIILICPQVLLLIPLFGLLFVLVVLVDAYAPKRFIDRFTESFTLFIDDLFDAFDDFAAALERLAQEKES
jgi:hypothetical protein